MNHKAELLDWESLGAVVEALREQKRWRELLLISCATYTGCRPGDWTKFTWDVFLNKDGSPKHEASIFERKPNNIAKAKGGRPKARKVFLLPQFLSTNTANEQLKKIAREFGLPDTITNYSFRKTCARRIYDSQSEPLTALRLTQRYLNHQSSSSTMHYIGFTDNETMAAFEKIQF
jgi:integrase